MNSPAVVIVSFPSCMQNLVSSLPIPQLLGVFFRLCEQLEWQFEQDEDNYLQDQALAATRYHNAICCNPVEILHALPKSSSLCVYIMRILVLLTQPDC